MDHKVRLKRLNKKTLAVSGIVLTLVTLFYWFQIRPAQIKHNCSWVTYKVESIYCEYLKDRVTQGNLFKDFYTKDIETCKNESDTYKLRDESYQTREATQKEYEFCLHDKGL